MNKVMGDTGDMSAYSGPQGGLIPTRDMKVVIKGGGWRASTVSCVSKGILILCAEFTFQSLCSAEESGPAEAAVQDP